MCDGATVVRTNRPEAMRIAGLPADGDPARGARRRSAPSAPAPRSSPLGDEGAVCAGALEARVDAPAGRGRLPARRRRRLPRARSARRSTATAGTLAAPRAGDGGRRRRRRPGLRVVGGGRVTRTRPTRAGSGRGGSRVLAIRDRLRELYGRKRNEPHGHPIAELVRTILSQHTNDRNRDARLRRDARALPDLGGGPRRADRGPRPRRCAPAGSRTRRRRGSRTSCARPRTPTASPTSTGSRTPPATRRWRSSSRCPGSGARPRPA